MYVKNRFIAERMARLPPYATQQMFMVATEMECSSKEVIHLEFGEPDFGTPDCVIEAAHKAMEEGYTRYTSSVGMLELREAIAERLSLDYGIDVDPKSEVIVLPGAKHAIYCSVVATVNPGEEVIVADPYFLPYEFAINLVGGKLVSVPLREELDFRLNPEELEKCITSKTKMLLLNFPHNPTGSVLTRDDVESIVEIARRRDILTVSDGVYEKFVFDGGKYYPVLAFPEMRERTIFVNSFSKTYAMTGWRLGYAVARGEIIERIRKVQESTTTCVPPFCQIAGMEALKAGDHFVKEMIREFDHRRTLLVQGLNKIKGVSCMMPKGAFFAFPNVRELGMDSFKLSEYLLKEAGVVTVPGSAFGRYGQGYLRLSYTNSTEKIEKALKRIEEAIAKLAYG